MISESVLQMQLARDQIFLQKLQYLMLQQARVVKEEPPDVPYHPQRSAYATTVLNQSVMAAQNAAGIIVGGPNLIGTVTIEDSGVVTTASDAAVLSQIATFWNTLSGVDSGVAS